MGARRYEVVLHGATGFTGGLAAQYLAQKENLRWAVSGRAREKLQSVVDGLKNVKSKPDIITVSIDDPKGLRALTASTSVVISTAGPFAKVGTPVVEACVEQGCDYVDITGEIPFVKLNLDRLEQAAVKNNVLVVSCCGFDSVPSDLGVLYGVQKLRERGNPGLTIGAVRNWVDMRGGLSGGTLASGINMEKDPELAALMNQPFVLGGAPNGGVRPVDKDVTTAEFDPHIGAWTGPFGMATINTRIVRRSNMLVGYGGDAFSYRETQLCASEDQAKKLASGAPPADKRQEMVDKGRLPRPGQGPSAEMRAKSWFKCTLRVEAADDPQNAVYVRVRGGDPGYDETAKMVCEAGLVLARKKNVLLKQGGFLTPAAAMGSTLIESLQASGIVFEQIPAPQKSKI